MNSTFATALKAKREAMGLAAQASSTRYNIPTATERLLEVYHQTVDLHLQGRARRVRRADR